MPFSLSFFLSANLVSSLRSKKGTTLFVYSCHDFYENDHCQWIICCCENLWLWLVLNDNILFNKNFFSLSFGFFQWHWPHIFSHYFICLTGLFDMRYLCENHASHITWFFLHYNVKMLCYNVKMLQKQTISCKSWKNVIISNYCINIYKLLIYDTLVITFSFIGNSKSLVSDLIMWTLEWNCPVPSDILEKDWLS